MKKKMLILCSLITLLLAAFQFPIYADEDPSDPPSSVPVPNSIRLDQYFFDNYDLLPYLENKSTNSYIDTGIKTSSELKISFRFSDINIDSTATLFGSRVAYQNDALYLAYNKSVSSGNFNFYNGTQYLTPYTLNGINRIYDVICDQNKLYLDGNLIRTLTYEEFSSDLNLYIFGLNNNGSLSQQSLYSLYNFSIYDYSSESYVRYYYPAKAKTSGAIGLYDAVSDTFFPSVGSVPFSSPIDDQVLNLQIGTFLTSSIGWITDILEFAITTPIILIFMAIGLAGAMFRWGRKLVHF